MKKTLLNLLVLALFSSAAFAGYITLDTKFFTKTTESILKVDMSAVNKGDESAFNVQAEIKIGGKYLIAEKKPELKVGEKYSYYDSIPLPVLMPGSYPAILTTHYTDANSYPFSAVTCQAYSYKGSLKSPLSGIAKDASIAKNGQIKFVINNPDKKEIQAAISLAAPKEIFTENNHIDFTCPAKTKKAIFFKVQNLGALAGSTYRVFGIVELDNDEKHSTVIIPATVKITANDGFLGLNFPTLLIILITLVLIFVILQFRRK